MKYVQSAITFAMGVLVCVLVSGGGLELQRCIAAPIYVGMLKSPLEEVLDEVHQIGGQCGR